MALVAYLAPLTLVAVSALAVTGWWRLAFRAVAIRPKRMTVQRLGLRITEPEQIERVDRILEVFAGGFNAMVASPSRSAWTRYCDALSPEFRPFAHEGAAMGHTARRLFAYRADVFEGEMVHPRPGMCYLSYVGLGFWSGMRGHLPKQVEARVQGLDPLHGCLCYDGYGFKHGFFDYLRDPGCLERLDALPGYARNCAYQGVGRSFWFLFMGDRRALIEHLARLGPYAGDAAAGLGLAAVFTYPDQLEAAIGLGRTLPEEWHDLFHLGVCFGLKARSVTDGEAFTDRLGRLPPSVRHAAEAAIRACDEAEQRIRREGGPDGYRRWRELVTQWMADHIEYPLAGEKQPAATTAELEPVSL